jgi:hypothetical protein
MDAHFSLPEYIRLERCKRLQELRKHYDWLCLKLEALIDSTIQKFLNNDWTHDCDYVMIPDIVGQLSERYDVTRGNVSRFCYIKQRDVQLFSKANIHQSIIMAVAHKIQKRGATLHDVSNEKLSNKIFLQVVLRPHSPAIKKRKHCHVSTRSSPTSPSYPASPMHSHDI